jgi:hypothetical protein
VKVYSTEHGNVVAMCDNELIGNIYAEGRMELNLKDYAEFYKGELVDESEAEDGVKGELIYSANVIGERSVGIFVKNGMAGEENIRRIRGIPFIQIYNLI